ncbi:MAG: hypothetical protein IJ532_03580 [Alphaproteobacteria bacterium]|nr:hypothetical protein [Alphaproteobacteria bacterium]
MRAASEIAALVVFVLLMIWLFGYSYQTVQEIISRFWPIGAGILLAYTVLSLTEDYLNNRIIKNYSKLT